MPDVKTKLQQQYPNATFPAPFAETFNIKFTKLNAGKAEGKVIVNNISPGFIKTNLTKKNLSNQDINSIKKKIPLGDLGKPQDIANITSFLISKEAGYISGANITVDGGYSCGAFMGI